MCTMKNVDVPVVIGVSAIKERERAGKSGKERERAGKSGKERERAERAGRVGKNRKEQKRINMQHLSANMQIKVYWFMQTVL